MRRIVAAFVVVCLGVIGVVSSIGPAFAAGVITAPTANPYSAPGDAAGNPQPFTVSASGFVPGANVFVEQCDGVPATQSGWDAAQDCDLGSSPSPAAADASGNVTFNAADPNHSFTPFKGESPQSLFNCLASGGASPGNGLTDYTNCQVRVSTNNTAGTSDQAFLTLTLPAAQVAPSFTGTPTTADVNQPYSFAFSSIVGTPAPTFTMSPASVAGITLSPTGVLSGTPTVSGSAQITVTAANGVAPNTVKTFTLSIAGDPNRPGFLGSPPAATVGTPYSYSFTNITGTPTPTFSMSPSSFAGGITLSPAGVLSGTPTSPGSFSVTVTATNGVQPDAVQAFTVPVGLSTGITTPTGNPIVVPGDAAGNPVAFTVVASGFVPGSNVFVEQCDGTPSTAVGWEPAQNCDVGSSPSPAVVDTNGNATFLSTDPNHAFLPFKGASPQGLFNCLSPFEASPNNGLADFRDCQLRVASNNVVSTSDQVFRTLQLPESVTLVAPNYTGTPTSGTVGSPYSFSFTGVTGNPAPSFSMSPSTVAGGISISPTGVLSGTPTTIGSFPITVTAANGVAPDAVKDLTLVIAPTAVQITTVSLPAARVGVAYLAVVQAAGGVTPYHWSIATGALPVGLTLNTTTGAISGTPKAAGTVSVGVRDTDSTTPTAQTATKSLSIAVAPTANPALGKVGVPYWTTVAAFAGVAPYHWSVSSGALPSGLTLNATTGVISGTPTAEGIFKPQVQVLDSKTPKATKVITKRTISIAPVAITITPSTLPHGTRNVKYSVTLVGSGGVAKYKFAKTAGALPPGFKLAPTGKLTGKPTAAGSFSFTVTATDKDAFTGSRVYVLAVS